MFPLAEISLFEQLLPLTDAAGNAFIVSAFCITSHFSYTENNSSSSMLMIYGAKSYYFRFDFDFISYYSLFKE